MNEEIMQQYKNAMAENLPMLRTKLKMTQEDLANILNISRHTIIGIENRNREMTWTTYLALIYIFQKNSETAKLAEILNIVPVEFNEIIEACPKAEAVK